MSIQTIALHIDGMTCQGCVKSVQNAVSQIAGVQSCEVDFSNHQATIVYDDNLAQLTDLHNAVEDAGFDIK